MVDFYEQHLGKYTNPIEFSAIGVWSLPDASFLFYTGMSCWYLVTGLFHPYTSRLFTSSQ